jgi:hypothetical protein
VIVASDALIVSAFFVALIDFVTLAPAKFPSVARVVVTMHEPPPAIIVTETVAVVEPESEHAPVCENA